VKQTWARALHSPPALSGVTRVQAGRPGRRAFVSGKRRQITIKTTTFSDGQGRILLSGVVRPGLMHDQTTVRSEGIAEQLHQRPGVKARVDSGYQGLAKEFPRQVSAPPMKPKGDAYDGDKYAWREARRHHSSVRICVKHTNAELRQSGPLRRFTGRREAYAETHIAMACLVSDRAAKRPSGPLTSTELVLTRDRELVADTVNASTQPDAAVTGVEQMQARHTGPAAPRRRPAGRRRSCRSCSPTEKGHQPAIFG
jgi:DDE superfamily endonuclease